MTYNPNIWTPEKEAAHRDKVAREVHRLIGLYQIQVGPNGELSIPSEIEAVRILNDSMHSSAAYLHRYASDRNERHLDDHEDYTDAASQIIVWVLRQLHNLESDLVEIVNRVLNAHRPEIEELEADCFAYSDHDTPIGYLMHMSRADDDPAGCDVCDPPTSYDDQNDSVRDN